MCILKAFSNICTISILTHINVYKEQDKFLSRGLEIFLIVTNTKI